MSRRLGASILALAIACALPAGAAASFPGRSGRIAFSAVAPGTNSYRIRAMHPDGSGLKTILTTTISNPTVQGEPSYSADGKRIVFENDDDIFVVDFDGTDLHQVTGGASRDGNPAFSPGVRGSSSSGSPAGTRTSTRSARTAPGLPGSLPTPATISSRPGPRPDS